MRLLFVCMGNICRSPTAEGVMRHLVRQEGLEDAVNIDSAGTHGYHVGEPADRRSHAEAGRRGVELASRARQVTRADFDRFDLLLAMDEQNHRGLLALAPDEAAGGRVRLLREFDPLALAAGDLDVPDPYYGAADGFAEVFEIIERACRGLLDEIAPRLSR